MNNNKNVPPLGEVRRGPRLRSPWGTCKRSLFYAPALWDEVRLAANEIRDSNDRDEFLLSIAVYAMHGIRWNAESRQLQVLKEKYWNKIDEGPTPASPERFAGGGAK